VRDPNGSIIAEYGNQASYETRLPRASARCNTCSVIVSVSRSDGNEQWPDVALEVYVYCVSRNADSCNVSYKPGKTKVSGYTSY